MQEQLRGEASNFAWRLGRCEKRARQLRRQMSAQLRWQSEDVTATETSSSTQLAFIVTLRVRFRPLPVLPGLVAPLSPHGIGIHPQNPSSNFV